MAETKTHPVCEDFEDDVMCDKCCDDTGLYYVKKWDKILCRDCLLKKAEREGNINTVTHYYTDDFQEICSDADLEPVINHLKGILDIQEVNNG